VGPCVDGCYLWSAGHRLQAWPGDYIWRLLGLDCIVRADYGLVQVECFDKLMYHYVLHKLCCLMACCMLQFVTANFVFILMDLNCFIKRIKP
jgi:hypothetical protein